MLLMVKCHVGSKSSPGLMVNSPEHKNAKKPDSRLPGEVCFRTFEALD